MCLEESRKMCLETSRELRAAMADDREWDRSLHRAQMDSFQAHVDARQSRQEAELKELKDNVALIKKFWEDTTRVPTPVDPRPTAEGAPTVKKEREPCTIHDGSELLEVELEAESKVDLSYFDDQTPNNWVHPHLNLFQDQFVC